VTPPADPDALLAWPDLLERPRPEPTASVRYGDQALQLVDVWIPDGDGPHPTVLMVHGGCWQSDIADRRIMNWIAEDLRKRGIAVWNIDYRGVDRPGGGYPGTFLDAAAAADSLRSHAQAYDLNLSPLVATGHSAGGHLALWLAARPAWSRRLDKAFVLAGSPILAEDPIRIDTAVSLGGIPDLEAAAVPPGTGCGTDVIARLVGPTTPERRDVFADTSIPRLAPIGVPQVLVNGIQDGIVPAAQAEAYAAAMRANGDEVRVRMIDRTGHIELIAPETEAWAAAAAEIEKGLGR
jgi:acetyl esterase/lipase